MKTRLLYRKMAESFCLGVLFWLGATRLVAQDGSFPAALTDDFGNRPTFAGPPYLMGGTCSNATLEADEPIIPGVSSGQTVWGSWTAPSNGIVTISPEASSFSPLLTVYTGSDLTNLTLVSSNNYLACYQDGDCGCHGLERPQIAFHVVRGQAYQICVDSAIITDASFGDGLSGIMFTTNVLPGGPFWLDFEFTPAPVNDDFSNRIRLSGSRISTYVSNAGATKEAGEPDHLGNPGGSSVWYSWTAPASGRVTLTTNDVPPYSPPASDPGDGLTVITIGAEGCGDEIDQDPPPVFYPIFAAYTGTAVNALTPADNLLMSLDAYPNGVEFDAVKGRTYQIAFDGNMGTTGEIPLFLAVTTPAANDTFAHAIRLRGVSVVATGYNAGAADQPGAPIIAGSSGKTAWWSWIAPTSGTVSLDLTGSDYSFPLAVFTGASVSNLQMVAQGAGGLSFSAVRGHTYRIGVSDDNGLTGAIKLILSGPIVDLPLLSTLRQGRQATLTYGASREEIVDLLSSIDDVNWTKVAETTAAQSVVVLHVTQAPTPAGPFYRAILFDDASLQ